MRVHGVGEIKAQMHPSVIKASFGQRIGIARALYQNPQVLILDESTSALDEKTEKGILEELRLMKGKVTMIIVAHRQSTLQFCDRIYKMESGRLELLG